jgi:hypothetical protein
MYPNWRDPLLPLLARYHAAVIRSDGLQDKLREGPATAELLDRSLAADEQVIEARAALRKGLIELGWTPPPDVAEDLELDEQVLDLPAI